MWNLDDRQMILRLIDSAFDNEPKTVDNKLEHDPGYITVKVDGKTFLITVEQID